MSKKANFFAIGLFVIIGFVITVSGIIVFGSGTLHKRTAVLLATFKDSTNGLREGAKVKAFGVEVGQVKKIMLHRIKGTSEVVIPVLLQIDLNHVGNLLGFRSLTDSDIDFCMQVLEKDSHATLQLESFVTGLLYVEMVFGLDQEGYILDSPRFSGYRAIPTAPTEFQVMKESLQTLALNIGTADINGLVEETKGVMADLRAQLNAIDLPGLGNNLNALVEEVRVKVNSRELESALADFSEGMHSFNSILGNRAGGTLDRLDATLDQLTAALQRFSLATESAMMWMDPASPVYQEVVQTLDMVGDASRALRILAEFIERNPNALITGKTTRQENP
ncbi:MAG: MlaD family protein [Oceanipulchritudo sp.]|jgi:paraquat-inducible protein B